MRKRVHLLQTFLILSLLSFTSCSVWDFFSAYFNTYYNAKRLYDEAQEEVWNQPEYRGIGRNLMVPLTIAQGTRVKFTSVIEKCSKLLQYHPESDLVDDALVMIGRSYYLQGEYQKAERKFLELIDGYPSSDLVPETRVLLAYSYYHMREPQKAADLAATLLEEAMREGNKAIVGDISLLLAQLAVDDKELALARDAYLRVGETADDTDKRAQAYLRAADLQAQLGEYTEAEQSFDRARTLSTFYGGEFRGRFGAARMLSRQGRYDNALDALIALRENANYREFFGEVDVEIGHTHRDHGAIDEAIDQYRYVDTAYARTIHAANAGYALGLLYEDRFKLYDSARVAYERGRFGPPQAEVMPQILRRIDYLGRYLQYSREIRRLDSTLAVLLAPPDSAAFADTTTTAVADTARRDSAMAAAQDSAKKSVPAVPPLHPDTVRVRLATAMDDLAGVLYTNMGLPDSARFWYRRLLHEYPDSKPAPRALYVLARIEGEDSTSGRTVADSLYREILRRYPDSPFADEARRLLGLPSAQRAPDPAEGSYGRASALLESGKAQAAIDTFKTIVRQHPTSPTASRALFAAGWIYEYRAKNMDSAAAVYERLVASYPGSPFAQRVQPRVNEVQAARRAALAKAQADSLAKSTPAVQDTTAVVDTDDTERRFQERRKAAEDPGTKPPAQPEERPPSRARETPEEKPVD